jgi:hypothetical protein
MGGGAAVINAGLVGYLLIQILLQEEEDAVFDGQSVAPDVPRNLLPEEQNYPLLQINSGVPYNSPESCKHRLSHHPLQATQRNSGQSSVKARLTKP